MPEKAIVAALLLVAGGVAFVFGSGGGSTTKVTKAPTGAPPWYAPYADVSLPMPQFPGRHIVLGFILGNRCAPTWGGGQALAQATTINSRIRQTQATGNQVIASFGGEAGPELAVSCTNPAQLKGAYQAVVRRYGLTMVDLDIESEKSLDPTVNARRAQAIATLQHAQATAGKPLSVWLTLAVTPSGLVSTGIATIKQMMAAGVTVSGVNVMAFDYGRLDRQTVLNASENAVTATAAQVRRLGLNSWSEVGATIMVGNTDTPGQEWSLASARSFYTFAHAHRLGRLSIWSLARDKQCLGNPPQPNDFCSGIAQQPLKFSSLLGRNAGQS